MADPKFVLNKGTGAKILKEFATGPVNDLAKKIAANAGPDAKVSEYTTDRAAASVAVPAYQQAKDGVLTRAASAAGATIRHK